MLFTLDAQDALILVSVYPKTGPMGKPKPSADDWKEILEDYQESYAESSFYEVRIVEGMLEVQVDDDGEAES